MWISIQGKEFNCLTKLRYLGLILGIMLSTSFVSLSWAAPSIDINIIEASQKSKGFSSPHLKKINRTLKASFKSFNHFKLVNHFQVDLSKKSNSSMKISAGLKMNLRLKKVIKQGLKLYINFSNKARKHTINAKFEKLFFEALRWKGKTYIISFKPHR